MTETFKPSLIVLHNTQSPSLKDRPNGFTEEHIQNLYHYYLVGKGWSATPHFFVDQHTIHCLTPPDRPGVHCIGHNHDSIGIEVLGNYDTDSADMGTGRQCWKNAAWLVTMLSHWCLGFHTWRFHRDLAKSRNCPGKGVTNDLFLELLWGVHDNLSDHAVPILMHWNPRCRG